jgi:transcriptional regulator with XRE-family HTH domain
MDRSELADFLTQHRQALKPSDVGLPAGSRRRVPGLRREEVAQLAAMSTDYYARLERQRGPQPSTQMLASLARALRLSADERDYLYRVAGHSAPDHHRASEHVAPGLLRVLDRLSDTPALILSALDEILVQNDLARVLFGDARLHTGTQRSGIYRWFIHPDTERSRYPEPDHDRQSRAQVASLRAAYGSMGSESRAGELVRELKRRSSEFATLWNQHEVARRFQDHKVLIHPETGPIELDCQALFTEDQSQSLLVLTAQPRSEAESKLKLLAVVGTQQFIKGP